MTEDFVYLNVAHLLDHYSNPSPHWREKILALAETQRSFFRDNKLLNTSASANELPIEGVIIRFSDLTPEGRGFIMSQAVERWLQACDRKGTVEAYKDSSGLNKRLEKYRKEQIARAKPA